MPDVVLDTTGLLGPMPVLRTKKALDSMLTGQVLRVSVNDAAAKTDVIYLAERLKLNVICISEEDNIIRIMIKK